MMKTYGQGVHSSVCRGGNKIQNYAETSQNYAYMFRIKEKIGNMCM